MLEDKTTKYNDDEIIKKGDEVLINELGISKFRRYLRLHRLNIEGQDYLKLQGDLYKDISIDELYDRAAESQEKYPSDK
jgi:hypothetical protein